MNRTQLAGLSLSAAALVGIALHEGYSPVAYTPVPGDVPTIGFGTTQGVKPGDTITPDRALVKLLADADAFQQTLKDCMGGVSLYQHEWDAIVSWAYNVGPSAACSSTLVRKAKAGDYAGMCAELLRWDKFKGQPLRGLTIRRQAEYRQCIGS